MSGPMPRVVIADWREMPSRIDGGIRRSGPPPACARTCIAHAASAKYIETNAAACKDADVKKSLVSAILDNVWQDEAKALLDKSCWNDARPVFETELANAKIGEDAKKNGCTFLAAKKVTPAACK